MSRDLDYTTKFYRDKEPIEAKQFDDLLRYDVDERNKTRKYQTEMRSVYQDLNNGYAVEYNNHLYEYRTIVSSSNEREILDNFLMNNAVYLEELIDKLSDETIKDILSVLQIKKENNEYSYELKKS